MQYFLKYGSSEIKLEFSETDITFIKHKEPEINIAPEIFRKDLEKNLTQIRWKDKTVIIVVADKTRMCGYEKYLPVIDEYLIENGIRSVEFIIAYGTHKKQTDEDSLGMYGEIFKRRNFIHHNCNEAKFKNLGITKRGTPVEINEEIFKKDIIITFGAVSHHYFAGFGGGRKLIFPGLAAKGSVYHNHSLYLDKVKKELHKGCCPGNFEGNPLAEDLDEIDKMLPEKMSVHGILNSKGEVCELLIGNTHHSFTDVCIIHDTYYKVTTDNKFDNVIASCGGFPKDINFIQAHKAIHNASAFVKNGGNLYVLAECRDGTGSDTFMKFFEMGYESAFEVLLAKYEGNGGTALAMMEKSKRINIHILTHIEDKYCEIMNVKKLNERELINNLSQLKGSTAIIENAGIIIKA